MANNSVVTVAVDDSEIVTEFFLTTCLRQPSEHNVCAARMREKTAALRKHSGSNDRGAENIPLITGSVAELYIRPILSCISDIDMMYHVSNMVAIPADCPPPKELPAEFDSIVKVCEIIDSEFPGYVFLKLRYFMMKCIYNATRVDRDISVSYNPGNHSDAVLCGPAQTFYDQGLSVSSYDSVSCVRCPLWPSQAADWPTRPRFCDWPDSATVDRVVSNGCDVVNVAHRLCRQEKRASQWRTSFSRAEIVLLNSWMPVQQIVYHMLRIFMKTERLTDGTANTGTKILSNYHIKTLMLWACEQQTCASELNVVRVCVKLLKTLSFWLSKARCPHYFINSCNLIDSTYICLETTSSQLSLVTESWLSTWYVNNYIRKCSQFCSKHVSQLCDDVSTSVKLHNAVLAVVNYRLSTATRDLWQVFGSTMIFILWRLSTSTEPMTAGSLSVLTKDLEKIDSSLPVYCTAMTFLDVAYKMPIHGFSDELIGVLAIAVGQPCYSHSRSNLLSLSKAAELMKVVANKSHDTVQMIRIELCKAYLHRTLRCNDADSNSIYCLANVYLAVLYYVTAHYQTAIDHCTLVLRSQDHSQCSSYVVQGELLPKMNDSIDSVLGLVVFYQYIRAAALKQQEHTVSDFTTEMFAHYLRMKSLSLISCRLFTQTSSVDATERYRNYVSDVHRLRPADLLLFKSVNILCYRQYHYNSLVDQHPKSTTFTTHLNTSQLVELLQQSAVDHLTEFRCVMAQKFQSVVTIVTTDFLALFVYKHGDYQHCLRLSTQNVRKLLHAKTVFAFSVPPVFIQLMDDDIVSLIALSLIIDPKCRVNVPADYDIDQLILSLYLMAQCQLELSSPVTQLAQTLDYPQVYRKRRRATRMSSLSCLLLKLIKCKVISRLRLSRS